MWKKFVSSTSFFIFETKYMLISNPLKLHIMKKSFLFFLAVAAFAVVTGCEEKIVSETPPEITLDATEITIPAEEVTLN